MFCLVLPDLENINNYTSNFPTEFKNKKALLIGINYIGTSNELFGCINDVHSITERIKLNGFTNITTLTDLTTNKPTKDNICESI